jgi:hypothetical protein
MGPAGGIATLILLLQHPRSKLEGRAVTNMLAVTAGDLGDPVALVITVETGNSPLHRASVSVPQCHSGGVRNSKPCENWNPAETSDFVVR